MHSILVNALALAAVTNALPSTLRKHHSHARREAGTYDNVDWASALQNVNWAAVFGQSQAAPAPAAASPAPAAASPASAATSTPAPAVAAAKAEVVAPVAATSASPASTAAPSSTASSAGGKKGLAWDQGNDPSLATLFETPSISWTYNWGMGASFSSSMQYLWQIRTAAELAQLGSMPKGATLLGFNEPDQNGMSAGQAAAYYKNQVTPLRQSGAIGALASPGITNGASGLPWLQDFMSQCSNCAIDFLQVHWYGPDFAMLQSQLEAVHAAFPSYQIAITEIGCTNWNPATNPSAAQISAFMTQAEAWLESTSWIKSYAFFGAMPITDTSLGVANEMLNGRTAGSSLTSLGQQYVA